MYTCAAVSQSSCPGTHSARTAWVAARRPHQNAEENNIPFVLITNFDGIVKSKCCLSRFYRSTLFVRSRFSIDFRFCHSSANVRWRRGHLKFRSLRFWWSPRFHSSPRIPTSTNLANLTLEICVMPKILNTVSVVQHVFFFKYYSLQNNSRFIYVLRELDIIVYPEFYIEYYA